MGLSRRADGALTQSRLADCRRMRLGRKVGPTGDGPLTGNGMKRDALDAALTGMFDKLQARGVPEHLQNVVDQLDAAALAEDARIAARLAATDDEVRPSPSPTSFPEP